LSSLIPSQYVLLEVEPDLETNALAQLVPVVLNLLFGSWPVAYELRGSEMWNVILRALQPRGISEVRLSVQVNTPNETDERIGICGCCRNPLLGD
jgi:hypothetical protein